MEKTSRSGLHWDILPCGVYEELFLLNLVFDIHSQSARVWPTIAQGHLGSCEHWGMLMVSKSKTGQRFKDLLQQGDGVYQALGLQLLVGSVGAQEPLQWKTCQKFNHPTARGLHTNGFIWSTNLR